MSSNGYICGWCGIDDGQFDARAVISDMQNCFSTDAKPLNVRQTHFMINTSGELYSGTSGIEVAIIGNPYWRDRELAALAANHGNAVACHNAYHSAGTGFLDKLAGRFLVVIRDLEKDRLVIAIDRIGQQQCYYSIIGQGVVFGTRADSVVSHPKVHRHVSSQGIYNYI